MNKRPIVIGMLMLFALILACALNGTGTSTYWVDDSYTQEELDSTHFNNIQDAVDATSPGDDSEIVVCEGTYYETVEIYNTNDIWIGVNSLDTVILSHSTTPTGDGDGHGFKVKESYDIQINDFYIRDIEKNGIFLRESDDVTIYACEIKDTDKHGIHMYDSDDFWIQKCQIESNLDHGISINGIDNDLSGNIKNTKSVSNNDYGVYILDRLGSTGRIYIEYCEFDDNGYGMYIVTSDGVVAKYCKISNNDHYGVYLTYLPESAESGYGYSTVKIKYSDIFGNNGGNNNEQVYDNMGVAAYDGCLWDYNYYSDYSGSGYYYIYPDDSYHAWNTKTSKNNPTIGDTGPHS